MYKPKKIKSRFCFEKIWEFWDFVKIAKLRVF